MAARAAPKAPLCKGRLASGTIGARQSSRPGTGGPTEQYLHYSPLPYSSLPILKDKISTLKVNFECSYHLIAPIEENTCIGKIKLTCENKDLLTCDLLLSHNIEKKNSFYYLLYFLKNYPLLLKN